MKMRKVFCCYGFESLFVVFILQVIVRIDSGMRFNTKITEQYYNTHVREMQDSALVIRILNPCQIWPG